MKPRHYRLLEFFRPDVAKRYGTFAWNFIDPRLLATMDYIRDVRKTPVWINHGNLHERGFRDNKSQIVSAKDNIYISPHCTGKGCDFNVSGESAQQTRQWLCEIAEDIPYPIRLEATKDGKPISWVHLDLYTYGERGKVELFDV